MSEDSMTRPERAAQIRQAKRYAAKIEKLGRCFACKHGDKTFGAYHCKLSYALYKSTGETRAHLLGGSRHGKE